LEKNKTVRWVCPGSNDKSVSLNYKALNFINSRFNLFSTKKLFVLLKLNIERFINNYAL